MSKLKADMKFYRKLAIHSARPGLINFAVHRGKQKTLYRLEILRDGDKRTWRIFTYPIESFGIEQTAELLYENARKQDLLDLLPAKWTIAEFYTAVSFYQIGSHKDEKL